MTSRVSWSVEGIEPSVRDRAEAAARRAGMSLNDWLNSTVGEPAPEVRNAPEVADIHHRLDAIAYQIERISQTAAPKREGAGVTQQLNDAISRLDERLSRISNPAPKAQQSASAPEHRNDVSQAERSRPVYRQTSTTIPELLNFDVAEIKARQSQLASDISRAARQPPATAMQPSAPETSAAPDLSGFEKQLQYLTSQIESLRRPDSVDQAITALRSELAEIRQAITEALPRRALESLENEIRSVARRIDEGRQNGVDGNALQNMEQALRDIHGTMLRLTPAEQLTGFDEAIRNLGGKIDMILRSNPDSGSVRQLEEAIDALRSISSNVATNDALSRLSDDVKALASRVETLTEPGGFSKTLAALEQRIVALTSALETRERPTDESDRLEAAVRTLSERIDHLQVGRDAPSTFAHVEQRVVQLLERLETTDARMADFQRVEEGLSDILRHLEQQRANFAALSEERGTSSAAMDQGFADALRRELSDIRHSQSETDRNTQDALESVHNALGHVVDRLAMIEGDLRETRAAKPAQDRPASASYSAPPIISSTALSAPMQAPRATSSPDLPARPELPNPAVYRASPLPQAPAPKSYQFAFDDGPSDDIGTDDRTPIPPAPLERIQPASHARIDPALPPDYPLEPGTRPQDAMTTAATPSQRIAASESALSEISAPARETGSTSSFIAAARRAAQAAAANPPGREARKESKKETRTKPGRAATVDGATRTPPGEGSKPRSRLRSLLVGASVAVIILSGFKIAMTMLDGRTPPAASIDKPVEKPPEKSGDASSVPSLDGGAMNLPVTAERAPASITASTPIEAQSPSVISIPALPSSPPDTNGVITSPVEAKPAAPDVTGTIAGVQMYAMPNFGGDRKTATPAPTSLAPLAPVTDKLPDTIGGPVLRTAAMKGDPAAAYEVGLRFAEGKGVPVNYEEAAKWYDRAADGGIVPAMFRLGTLYEKGLAGAKDIDAARRYYIRAAERGNAKAMHNLAVLDADGGNKGPNYKSAAEWFRKAAERGVADSQFNLGILYARGIGVEQNLAESFKWFTLAAAQGDADSVRKRDDVAKRLDAQSLAAGNLAVQTFVIEKQPDDAINVPAPAAGWDAVPAAAASPASKRGVKPINRQSASAH
jgi:localization factor PodJL